MPEIDRRAELRLLCLVVVSDGADDVAAVELPTDDDSGENMDDLSLFVELLRGCSFFGGALAAA